MALAWDQFISLVGAFLILIGYAMQSLRPGVLRPLPFQLLNAIGSLGLFIAAVIHLQYGFIILEGSWFIISLVALLKIILNHQRRSK